MVSAHLRSGSAARVFLRRVHVRSPPGPLLRVGVQLVCSSLYSSSMVFTCCRWRWLHSKTAELTQQKLTGVEFAPGVSIIKVISLALLFYFDKWVRGTFSDVADNWVRPSPKDQSGEFLSAKVPKGKSTNGLCNVPANR